MNIKKGSTDVTTYVNLVDSAAGTPETGLTITNIDATYTRNRAAAVKNDLTALGAANSAHADNQGIEVDATNAPGIYRIDWPDAAFASGADKVVLTVTCSGCAPASVIVQLVNYDPEDAVRMGMTALPNAAADAAGGLPISDAGGLDLDARLDAAVSSRQVAIWSSASATVDLSNTTIHNIDGLGDEPFSAQVGENFNLFFQNDGQNTARVVDDIAAGGGASAADIADAVWDEATSGHTTSGTFGEQLKTDVDAILADTNELQTDWVNGGRLDLLIDGVKAKTDSLTFTTANRVDSQVFGMEADTVTASAIADNAIDAGAIASSAITSAKFAAGAITASVIATDAIDADALAADAIAEINATVDTALADYDGPTNAEMVARTIAAADYATAAALDTVDNFLDTEVAAIKAKTDNLPAAPASTGDVTGVWTTAMTESYAADGATITPAQGLYMILQSVNEFAISGTTLTVKKLDGSTTAMTATLNDATNPTSRTRSG